MDTYAYYKTPETVTEERQIRRKLLAKPVEETYIFSEPLSKFDVFEQLRFKLSKGGILYISSVLHLGATYKQMVSRLKDLRDRGVFVIALDQEELFNSVKFSAMGQVGSLIEDKIIETLLFIADHEHQKRYAPKENNVKLGRKKVDDYDDELHALFEEILKGNITRQEALRRAEDSSIDISTSTFDRRFSEFKKEQAKKTKS